MSFSNKSSGKNDKYAKLEDPLDYAAVEGEYNEEEALKKLDNFLIDVAKDLKIKHEDAPVINTRSRGGVVSGPVRPLRGPLKVVEFTEKEDRDLFLSVTAPNVILQEYKKASGKTKEKSLECLTQIEVNGVKDLSKIADVLKISDSSTHNEIVEKLCSGSNEKTADLITYFPRTKIRGKTGAGNSPEPGIDNIMTFIIEKKSTEDKIDIGRKLALSVMNNPKSLPGSLNRETSLVSDYFVIQGKELSGKTSQSLETHIVGLYGRVPTGAGLKPQDIELGLKFSGAKGDLSQQIISVQRQTADLISELVCAVIKDLQATTIPPEVSTLAASFYYGADNKFNSGSQDPKKAIAFQQAGSVVALRVISPVFSEAGDKYQRLANRKEDQKIKDRSDKDMREVLILATACIQAIGNGKSIANMPEMARHEPSVRQVVEDYIMRAVREGAQWCQLLDEGNDRLKLDDPRSMFEHADIYEVVRTSLFADATPTDPLGTLPASGVHNRIAQVINANRKVVKPWEPQVFNKVKLETPEKFQTTVNKARKDLVEKIVADGLY